MLPLDQYMSVTGESRRNTFLKLSDGRLLRKKIDGQLYIIQPSELHTLNGQQKELILKDKRKEWDSLIMKAHKSPEYKSDVMDEILEDVKAYTDMGFKIVGFDIKSLYRKIKKGKINRKTRKDKSKPKNSILQNRDVQAKLMKFAQELYYQDSNASIRLLTHRVLFYAKQNEELLELAAIPQPTLYRFLDERFDENGIKEAHKMINHYDQWNKNKPFVQGAFTKDIDFMDWLALDDHMIQISGVQVYNELSKKIELKTVYAWFIIEAKTFYPVAYDIQIREFNSNDIKLLMLKALMNVGKPNKGFLMDNGLGSASANLQMLNQLGVGYKTTQPYDPTGKATIERFFGLFNRECAALINNYIGGKRIDGRHSTLRLSPEEAMLNWNDIKELVDQYIQGFFLDRPRKRPAISEKEISIREHYNKESTTFGFDFLKDEDMRFAFNVSEIKKFDGQKIMLGKHGIYVPSEALPSYLNGRKYDVRYNPIDMNEIDMYNLKALRTPEGDIIGAGQKVATLMSFTNKGNAQKQELANKVWKDHRKNVRATSKSTVDISMLQNNIGGTYSNQNADLVDTRKSLEKRISTVLADETLKLATLPAQALSPETEIVTPAAELTFDTSDIEEPAENSLTYGDE